MGLFGKRDAIAGSYRVLITVQQYSSFNFHKSHSKPKLSSSFKSIIPAVRELKEKNFMNKT
jgi:hypothetical protein